MIGGEELFDVKVIEITKSERRPRIFSFKSRLYVEGKAVAIPHFESESFNFDFTYEGAVDEDPSVMLDALRGNAAYHYRCKVIEENHEKAETLESYVARLGGERQNG